MSQSKTLTLIKLQNVEISENLLNDPRSRVWNQAENRLHAQKGLLLELLK